MARTIDHPQFIEMLRQRFPQVAEAIDDCSAGLLHPEMATLRRATVEAIRKGDVQTVRAHFASVDEVYGSAGAAVENAVNVSYLEHINFEGRRAKAIDARGLLTPRLRKALKELEQYWEALDRASKA